MNKWIGENIKKIEASGFIHVTTNDSKEYINELQGTGQILVDSNEITFVYILEDQNNYAHLRIPVSLWGDLALLREEHLPMYATFSTKEGNVEIELVEFFTELNTLLENIRGNANYGEKLVATVESSFLK